MGYEIEFRIWLKLDCEIDFIIVITIEDFTVDMVNHKYQFPDLAATIQKHGVPITKSTDKI